MTVENVIEGFKVNVNIFQKVSASIEVLFNKVIVTVLEFY